METSTRGVVPKEARTPSFAPGVSVAAGLFPSRRHSRGSSSTPRGSTRTGPQGAKSRVVGATVMAVASVPRLSHSRLTFTRLGSLMTPKSTQGPWMSVAFTAASPGKATTCPGNFSR